MTQPSVSPCCLRGFAWEGTPIGDETKLGTTPAYVVGAKDSEVGILLIHDLFGWKFPNLRLLADYHAENIGARVWVPDFYDGEVLNWDTIMSGDWSSLDLPSFIERNSKDKRRDEIFSCARELRKQHRRVGAMGFCYGGWAVMELGAAKHNPKGKDIVNGHGAQDTEKTSEGDGLVDCIAMAHPSWVTNEDIDALGVPTQIQAPENDSVFLPALKEYAQRVIPTLGIPYEYVFFPGVEHGFATRGDSLDPKSKHAMRRSMQSAVAWFKFWLKPDESKE